MKKTTVLYIIALSAGLLAAVALAQNQAAVEFTPQGTVKGIKQVRARFSEAMVPFGFLKQPLKPFETNCNALCFEIPLAGNDNVQSSVQWF